eukprot:CAMPEP_0195530650 /NCGR_PEP_ID=MMETSP0794_2-20130614/33633_1 /TAXON_ID=515487 /ORGANISM="Stephanopyxis turris, Strain CCMP 815" /LENGTH=414 /DNA_ID=CAMNT_0040662207 /DNA_START=233 /DNA_END=1477 /DNA_ORIENTATION=+
MEQIELGEIDSMQDGDSVVASIIEESQRQVACRKILVFSTGMFLFGLLTGALIMGVEKANSLNPPHVSTEDVSTTTTSMTKKSNNNKRENTVIPPPSNLGYVCSEKGLQSENGLAECASACDRAECCWITQSPDSFCFVGNELVCSSYQPCTMFFGKMLMPAAIRSHVSDGGGNMNENAVVVGTTDRSNDNSNGDHKNGVETTIEMIAESCTSDYIEFPDGRQTCEQLCAPFQCCFGTPSSPEKKDINGESKSCTRDEKCATTAAPCLILYEGIDPNMEEDLDEEEEEELLYLICSDDSLSEKDGRAQCESQCQYASCCFFHTEGVTNDCFGESICQYYSPCEKLFAENFQMFIDTVQDMCSPNTIEQFGIEECRRVCSGRWCCFTDREEDNCYQDNKGWCDEYDLCRSALVEE